MKFDNIKILALGSMLTLMSSAMQPKPILLWYEYIGGPETKPSSFNHLVADPGYSGTQTLAAIAVKPNANNPSIPDSLSLQRLYTASYNFLSPGSYVDGVVERKDD